MIESGVENAGKYREVCTVPVEEAGLTISPPGRRGVVLLLLLLSGVGEVGGDD